MMIGCLIFVNAIAFMAGVVTACLGLWTLMAPDSFVFVLALIDKSLQSGVSMEKLVKIADDKGVLSILSGVLVAAGVMAVIVAFIGIMAAMRRSQSMGILYTIALVCLTAGQIAFSAVLVTQKSETQDAIRTSLLKAQNQYFVARTQYFNKSSSLHISYTEFFEHMHISYKCCGVAKRDDFKSSASYKRSVSQDPSFTQVRPASCCAIKNAKEALAQKPVKLVELDCPYLEDSKSMYKKPCFIPVVRLVDTFILPALVCSGCFVSVLAAALGMMVAQLCSGFDDDDDDSDSDYDSDSSSDSD